MKKKTHTQYFHRWPKLKRNRIRVKLMSPKRMIVVQKLVYDPLTFFLKLWCSFFVINYFLMLLGAHSLFELFDGIKPQWLICYIVTVLLLIGVEINSRFALSRKFFGQLISITFKEEEIEIWIGNKRQTFSKEDTLSFAMRSFGNSDYPTYHKSRKLQIVINDHHSVTLAEVFDLKLIEKLVENCNYANLHTQRHQDFDVDPRTMARTIGE